MTVAIVIPWRDTGCPSRARNLAETMRHLAPLGWDIVTADDESREPFSASAARNRGVERTDADVIVLHDADLRVPLEAIERAAGMALGDGRLHHPYRHVHYLDEAGTHMALNGQRPPRSRTWHVTSNAPGGIGAIRRDSYQRIGGYDESFAGWGHEDLDFQDRARAIIGQRYAPGIAWHLWHPPAPRDEHTEANRARAEAKRQEIDLKAREGLPDVVYRVRSGANEELRYSLRSLVNVPHRRVFIVGDPPEWVRNATVIPGNPHPTKWPNVYDNLRIACQHPEISDPFVLLDDDMYILEPMSEPPAWHRDTLAAQVKRTAPSLWGESLSNTLTYLRSVGIKDPITYELHIPYLVHKSDMLAVLDAARDWSWPVPPQWRTLDGNVNQRGGTEAPDVKLRAGQGARFGPLLSTTDATFPRARRVLHRAFPKAGPYEEATPVHPKVPPKRPGPLRTRPAPAGATK